MGGPIATRGTAMVRGPDQPAKRPRAGPCNGPIFGPVVWLENMLFYYLTTFPKWNRRCGSCDLIICSASAFRHHPRTMFQISFCVTNGLAKDYWHEFRNILFLISHRACDYLFVESRL